MIKAVTFDLFDTLTPAADFDRQRQAALYEFTREKVCPVSFERFRQVERRHLAERFDYICSTLREVVYDDRFPLLFKELSGEEPSKTLVEEASIVTRKAIADAFQTPDFIPSFLDELSRRVPLAVISNFPHSGPIYEGLEKTGIIKYFKFIIISSDFGFTKPHPSIFHEAAKRLEVNPNEILHVGDDWVCDVLGASNAGFKPVFLTQWKDEEKIRLSAKPEHFNLMCSHLKVDPELKGVLELKDITRLSGLIQESVVVRGSNQ